MNKVKASVCASNCTNLSDPVVYHQLDNIWKTQYARAECRDCLRTLCVWKNLSHPFWQTWELTECKNLDFLVDETKITFHSHNPNRDWPFHLMIIALATHKPVQYWIEAPARCRICNKETKMTSTYSNIKTNGHDVLQIHEWKIKAS